MIPNLKIDPQRLWDTLMDTAKIGGTPATKEEVRSVGTDKPGDQS